MVSWLWEAVWLSKNTGHPGTQCFFIAKLFEMTISCDIYRRGPYSWAVFFSSYLASPSLPKLARPLPDVFHPTQEYGTRRYLSAKQLELWKRVCMQ